MIKEVTKINIFDFQIKNHPAFKQILEDSQFPVMLTGLSGVHKAHFVFGFYENNSILLVCNDEAGSIKIASDINVMAGSNLAKFFPSKDFIPDNTVASREFENQRLSALSEIYSKGGIICASVEALMQKTISKSSLIEKTILIAEDSQLNVKTLSVHLTENGYQRCEMVEGIGQFSVRGDIFDIFPVGSANPIRIELWGDDIDSISYFDIESQRRTLKITIFEIPPALESLGGEGSVLEYISGAVIFNEYTDCLAKSSAIIKHYYEQLQTIAESSGTKISENDVLFYTPLENIAESLNNPVIYISTFLKGNSILNYKRLINVNAIQSAPWGGDSEQLYEDLNSYIEGGYITIFAAGNSKTLGIIKEDLIEKNIPCEIVFSDYQATEKHMRGKVLLVEGGLSGSYEYPDIKFAMITRQKQAVTHAKKSVKKQRGSFSSLSELSPGDLVVHSNYGIGRFITIEKIEVDGLLKDYITIQYAGSDTLSVPVTQLDMVSRYIAPRDEADVKLNSLSGSAWQRTKSKAKKSVKNMAEELVKLYALREKAEGFAFYEDDEFQKDFEDRFPYNETDDQLRCISEIKEDMGRSRPMDRLLCGDVGFGKTEVALRAAFKCVEAGKQCAILAPTTVLAWQHYKTALGRFEHFPVNIEHISRFRNARQQREILEKLKNGKIDIIIGTHRLIQKDVIFKDLGLAIIDEEQRFGVAHKEKFKNIYNGVDVLTLSATPIPRTLNMAMSGIRDMSVIEEPPQDRYPVQTFVFEQDAGIIIAAISKELKRGGQVYYIHNRVESISLCASQLKKYFPDANVEFAHGQMAEDEMNAVWERMVDGEIDILVCTTIIETGVDVPNVNTLFIENADKFGLSQLYQLRGRVGRSNRRAYAYFMFQRGKMLTEIAEKRLKAIKEFTQFGSGFHIAMRDLEIRGAGSILGGSQHGHMEAIGYDMYIRLLNEAVAEIKGEPKKKRVECLIDLKIDAHIPEDYIEGLNRRLEIYRKIANLSSQADSENLIDEIIDRYGEPPKSIMGLIDISLMRNLAGEIGIAEITRRKNSLYFTVQSLSMNQINTLQSAYADRITFNGADRYFSVRFKKGETDLELMKNVLKQIKI